MHCVSCFSVCVFLLLLHSGVIAGHQYPPRLLTAGQDALIACVVIDRLVEVRSCVSSLSCKNIIFSIFWSFFKCTL